MVFWRKISAEYLLFWLAFSLIPREAQPLGSEHTLASVDHPEPEPETEPESDLCEPFIENFPICLANVKTCNLWKDKGKIQLLEANRKACKENNDDYDKFMEYRCKRYWCEMALQNKNKWEQEKANKCASKQFNSDATNTFCRNVGNNLKAFSHLNCSLPTKPADEPMVTKPRTTTEPSTTSGPTGRKSRSLALESVKNSCGRSPPTELTVAVSGSEKKISVPWAVSIGRYDGDTFLHECTGSILAPSIVLSAAHCVTSGQFDRQTFRVWAGMHNLKERSGSERFIKKAIFHKKWQRTGKHVIYFDVSLLFLEDPFTFSKSLQPICLPSETYPILPPEKEGFSITTAGWGRDDDNVIGKQLTVIDVTIRSNKECNYKYENETDRLDRLRINTQLPDLLTSTNYCADNNVNKNVGTCHGDSGGPSFVRNFDNGEEQFTIFGVTSGSVSCGGSFPDFYTFLAHDEILPWIHSAAAKEEESQTEFHHLSSDDWVHCKTGSECSSGLCKEDLCLPMLTQSNLERLGPSSKCLNEKKPCHDGKECTVATCNRYGNACFCPQSKQKSSVKENTQRQYVTGHPENWTINCLNSYDCPADWFCEEQLCLAPLTFPSGAWASLSAPVVGGIRTLSVSSPLGAPWSSCPNRSPCKPGCTSPVCNSLNRCWCVARGWKRRNG